MQTNGNTSPEQAKKSESLENILGEYENTAEKTSFERTESSKEKLDRIFREHEEDMTWLEGIMVGKTEEDEAEDNGEVIQEILAENADDTELYQEAPESDDIIEEDPAAIEAITVPEDDNDGSTKVFGAVKEASEDDEEGISFEMFEADNAEEEEISDAEIADDSESSYALHTESTSLEQDKALNLLFGEGDANQDNIEENNPKKKQKNKTEKTRAGADNGAFVKKEAVKPEKDELDDYVEIDMADENAVTEGKKLYAVNKRKSYISLFGTAVLLLIGLYMELAPKAGFPYPGIFASSSALYALVDLQILCFAAMLMLDSLGKGVLSIVDKRFSPAACAFVTASVSALQAIVSAFFAGSDIRLFCSVGILALFALAVYNYLHASADDKAFRIASSTSSKFGAFEIETTSPECVPFISHIENNSNARAISIKKGRVYEGFAERNHRRPKNEKNLGKLTLAAFIVSVVVGVFMAIAQNSFYQGFTSATIVFVSSLPINIFFVSALPKYIASAKGKQLEAALIGQNASEEYNNLSIISFDDTEVFLPKDVRISSIKTYGGMALDEAVVLMSKIYGKIGGPLSKIFAKMMDVNETGSAVKLEKVYADALDIKVDGRYVCVATSSYLSATGIKVISDSVDAAFEQSHGSILYLVLNRRVFAKFYIKYSINPNFERTLAELHEANLCVGIKTLDPCINNELVFGCLEKANYALSVIKGTPEDIPHTSEKVSSGVIALGSVHNFLEMLLVLERTGRNVRINNVIKLISLVLCLVLSTAFVLTNSALNVIFCLIIQIFWLLPVAVISYLNK